MKKQFYQMMMFAVMALVIIGTLACSKHKGFKKHESGFYYKTHILNNSGEKLKLGDIVEAYTTLRVGDSILNPASLGLLQVSEPLYKGDIFEALTTMHVGDSSTFIMHGDTFAYYYMGGAIFEFENKDLYFDIKVNKIISQDEIEAQQEAQRMQYEMILEEMKNAEEGLILNYIEENNINVKPTASGLYVIKTTSGIGKKVTDGAKVNVHYTGRTLDGQIFDSSIERGVPFELIVGKGNVIQGWDEALLLMKAGDKATLIIPSKLAYGERGIGYMIPPYAPLVFDIEVITVE